LSSSLLSKRASETDEGKRIVVTGKRIQRYAARMNRLIGDLVDVVSIDAGHLSCKIVPSDPLALIAETLETFRRAAEEKGIVLQSEVTGALPPAAFDYERMLQVLSNLVSNALNFTPRDGKIGIRGERTGDKVHLSVSDTGLGIPPNMFEALFLRFWQAPTNDPRARVSASTSPRASLKLTRARSGSRARSGRAAFSISRSRSRPAHSRPVCGLTPACSMTSSQLLTEQLSSRAHAPSQGTTPPSDVRASGNLSLRAGGAGDLLASSTLTLRGSSVNIN
jgi:hypothetical protein